MVSEPVSASPAFQDRYEAGERLAEVLKNESFDNALVLGLARGGVAVAQRVAEKLALPLDVMVARKIQSPHQPELAIGAVAPHGMTLVDLASKQRPGGGVTRKMHSGNSAVDCRRRERDG